MLRASATDCSSPSRPAQWLLAAAPAGHPFVPAHGAEVSTACWRASTIRRARLGAVLNETLGRHLGCRALSAVCRLSRHCRPLPRHRGGVAGAHRNDRRRGPDASAERDAMTGRWGRAMRLCLWLCSPSSRRVDLAARLDAVLSMGDQVLLAVTAGIARERRFHHDGSIRRIGRAWQPGGHSGPRRLCIAIMASILGASPAASSGGAHGELVARVKFWWVMVTVFSTVALFRLPAFSAVFLALISYLASRNTSR